MNMNVFYCTIMCYLFIYVQYISILSTIIKVGKKSVNSQFLIVHEYVNIVNVLEKHNLYFLYNPQQFLIM